MELVTNKKDCCGCALCYNICPKKAIKMVEDENGFVYPEIDKEKCIECGLCKKYCIYQKENKNLQKPISTYVATSKDDKILENSASGGAFASIAKKILEDNGVVYGAAIEVENDLHIVKHIRVDTEKELYKLQGSKYVQSDIKGIYHLIKEDLEKNKNVLFSGTPCQVNAIKQFLNNKEYDNFYSIDIICHGVPSNKMFDDYIKFLEKKEKGRISDFCFRDKNKGWGNYFCSYKVIKKNKTYKRIKHSYRLSYYQLFLDSAISRENCYSCPYAQEKRIGDITIGDYWKIGKEHPEYLTEINEIKGVSCVIVNSEKGNKILEKYSKEIKLLDSQFDIIKRNNAQLMHPSKKSGNRATIFKLYKDGGIEYIDRDYFKKNKIKIIVKSALYKAPKSIKEKVKKLLKRNEK